MNRINIIDSVGKEYLTSNIENSEFSYVKAYSLSGLPFPSISDNSGRQYQNIDLRFQKNNITVLIETKDDFKLPKNKKAKEQLSAYVEYEKALTGNKIIAILANTDNDDICVYRGAVSDTNIMTKETMIRSIDEYADFYAPKINNKEKVMTNTYALNKILHKHSIPEKLRSQFVGTCLLALKNGLVYSDPNLTTNQILSGIKDKLETILTPQNSTIEKSYKVGLLYKRLIENQSIRQLSELAFKEILSFIDTGILPFINDKSTAGQDLLNLFFVTFNKYVGKADKNQAFTPDHITDFMTKITRVNYKSRVLDMCCGSGAFLVRAMTTELDDCPTEKDQIEVKKDHIFGIEYDENVAGLVITNMLIHGDGNSNIMTGSCFDYKDWIMTDVRPNIVLMNPPYNCQRVSMDKEYISSWKKNTMEDPSSGLYFVKWICDIINNMGYNATIAVLLPVSCAIGSSSEIERIKTEILKHNTIDAVFTLPKDIFHPGANVNSCCMVFKTGIPQEKSGKTFFGYYKNDGFKKRKNIGRVEETDADGNSKWERIEREWIELYQNRTVKDGISAVAKVDGSSEWLCEAYMNTDYSSLSQKDFQESINEFIAYEIKDGQKPLLLNQQDNENIDLDINNWKWFKIKDIFTLEKGKCGNSNDLEDGDIVNYIGAKRKDNGVMKSCKYEASLISKGNCVAMIGQGEGSAGYAIYIDRDFIGATSLNLGYTKWMNKYAGLFISTVLCKEYNKYSFGRSWSGDRLKETEIKLPATASGEIDTAFMEKYIRSLYYGNSI